LDSQINPRYGLTKEEKRFLRLAAHHKVPVVAKKLGISIQAVYKRLRYLREHRYDWQVKINQLHNFADMGYLKHHLSLERVEKVSPEEVAKRKEYQIKK